MKERDEVTIGVISDTHGLLRPEALEALRGTELILHAGDIGRSDLIGELEGVAPVIAIRGNIDMGSLWQGYPASRVVEVEGRRILMLHDIAELEPETMLADVDVVIYGHSHQPSIEHREGVLYLNPGSAGRRRFRLPITLARLRIEAGTIDAELIDLDN